MLNEKEKKIKERLFSIGSLISSHPTMLELFGEENIVCEQEDFMSICGNYTVAGKDWAFGKKMIDDEESDITIKWIITGNKKYYNLMKDIIINRVKRIVNSNRERIESKRQQQKISKHKAPVKGYIYLLKSVKLYKIGKTLQIDNRIHQYKTENPHEAELIISTEVDDYVKAEKYLLDKYSKYQVRGEWFKLNKIQVEKLKKDIELLIWGIPSI